VESSQIGRVTFPPIFCHSTYRKQWNRPRLAEWHFRYFANQHIESSGIVRGWPNDLFRYFANQHTETSRIVEVGPCNTTSNSLIDCRMKQAGPCNTTSNSLIDCCLTWSEQYSLKQNKFTNIYTCWGQKSLCQPRILQSINELLVVLQGPAGFILQSINELLVVLQGPACTSYY
jgi:hypothetical protein